MKYAVPISVHGDAIPVVRVGKPGTESLECISMQSLLAFGQTLKVKILLHSMFESNKVSGIAGLESSMVTVWKNICWSLEALYEGEFPKVDASGRPWDPDSSDAMIAGQKLCSDTEPYFGVLWSIKGDLDWYFKGLGLKSYNSVAPCEYCPCSRALAPSMWPTNFGSNADWKGMLFSAEVWRAGKTTLHSLFSTFSFLSQHNLEADELHILHLGVSQYYLGSLLWLLTYDCLEGTAEENFGRVWDMILEEYTSNPPTTEYSRLKLSSFHEPSEHDQHFPKLKGRGGEVKSLLLPMRAIWAKLKKPGLYYEKVCESL